MKNLTLRIDAGTLAQARRVAARRATSVNALIRDYLEQLADEDQRRAAAREELLRLCGESTARVGEVTWRREDLHDR